jgi:hypothetical protein
VNLPGREEPIGSVLFVDDGKLDCLEMFAYATPWPEDRSAFSIEHEREPGDPKEARRGRAVALRSRRPIGLGGLQWQGGTLPGAARGAILPLRDELSRRVASCSAWLIGWVGHGVAAITAAHSGHSATARLTSTSYVVRHDV